MILNSRDGQWIYFYSGRDKGTYQLWKAPFKGGSPVRVTSNGGIYAIESVDGRFLYYSKFGEPGVWKRPLDGGEESRVPINVCCWFGWDVARSGIYFLNLDFPPNDRIEFFALPIASPPQSGSTSPSLSLRWSERIGIDTNYFVV